MALSLVTAQCSYAAVQHYQHAEQGDYGPDEYEEFDEQAYTAWPYRPARPSSTMFLTILIGAGAVIAFVCSCCSNGNHNH
jgi:hypothetical protein